MLKLFYCPPVEPGVYFRALKDTKKKTTAHNEQPLEIIKLVIYDSRAENKRDTCLNKEDTYEDSEGERDNHRVEEGVATEEQTENTENKL